MHSQNGREGGILDNFKSKVTYLDYSLVNGFLAFRQTGNPMCFVSLVFHSRFFELCFGTQKVWRRIGTKTGNRRPGF